MTPAPQQARALLAETIHRETRSLLAERLAEQDTDGLFEAVPSAALHTILGVALAHAALWRLYGGDAHRTKALELTARYLHERGRPRAWPRPIALLRTNAAWNSREAIEAGSTLGWILLALGPSLAAAETAPLLDTVLRTRGALRGAGDLRYYINGNYAIPLCELAYLWQELGDGGERQYELCWQTLVKPAWLGSRWEGYGWIATTPPDGGAGAEGYFSETPGYAGRLPSATFDAEYSQLQTERLARLWLLNGDERALSYLGAIHRTLLHHLDRERWRIHSRGASRVSGSTAFCGPASALIVLCSPQPEVSPEFALEQFRHGVLPEYGDRRWASNPYLVRGLGTILTPLLLASAAPTRGRRFSKLTTNER